MLSASLLIFARLFGATSHTSASSCVNFTLSPVSRYTFASWNSTFDSPGDRAEVLQIL